MDDYKRAYEDVNLDVIKNNVDIIMKRTKPGTKALIVVKADAYGHGDVPVARALESRADYFAVATGPEAINLRENSITKPILILGFVAYEEYEDLINNDVDLVIFDKESADALSEAAKKIGKTAKCHVKVDTGMRRIGVEPVKESVEIVKYIKGLDNVDAHGIFTHFFAADSVDKSRAQKQYKLFTGFIDMCKDEGVTFDICHCANSAAAMEMPETNMDMVRIGISMYGLDPSEEVPVAEAGLAPAMSLKCRISMVKTIHKGDSVGYGGVYVADEDRKIATLSIGYADGYPRSLSNKGYVLINGKKANIVGNICMDQLMVDCTDIEDVKRGDIVTMIGTDGDESIRVEDLSAISGRFNYEFVCGITKRIPRNYYENGNYINTHERFHEKW